MNIPHSNFFETVEYYKEEINKIDFDIALLACGSYAHFIGEYVKTIGKKPFMWEEYYSYGLEFMEMLI